MVLSLQSGGFGAYPALDAREEWPGVSDALVTYATSAASPLPAAAQHFYSQVSQPSFISPHLISSPLHLTSVHHPIFSLLPSHHLVVSPHFLFLISPLFSFLLSYSPAVLFISSSLTFRLLSLSFPSHLSLINFYPFPSTSLSLLRVFLVLLPPLFITCSLHPSP